MMHDTHQRTVRRFWPLALAAMTLGACGSTEEVPESTSARFVALASYSAPLGTSIDAYINRMPAPGTGRVELGFDGTFTGKDGTVSEVHFSAPTAKIDRSTVRWRALGPFSSPFTPANPQPGIFRGTVAARTIRNDGSVEVEPNPNKVMFQVQESILIEDFQPAAASCDGPAKRAFVGLPYRVRARALGFVPVLFKYTLRIPQVVTEEGIARQSTNNLGAGQFSDITIVHDASSDVDTVEGGESFQLPPMPDGAANYYFHLSVQASDSEGRIISTGFAMRTDSPVTLYYDGRNEVAQYEEPQPLSGCVAGGPYGSSIGYVHSESVTKSRSVTTSVSQSWMKQHSLSNQNTWSTQNGTTISQSTSDTAGWDRSTSHSASDTTSSSNSFQTSLTGHRSSSSTLGIGWSTGTDWALNGQNATSGSFSLNLGSSHGTSDSGRHDEGKTGTHDTSSEGEGELAVFVGGTGKWGEGDSNTVSEDKSTTLGTSSGSSLDVAFGTGWQQQTGWSTGHSSSRNGSGSNTYSESNGYGTTEGSSTSKSHTDDVTEQNSQSGSTAITDSTATSRVVSVGGASSQSATQGNGGSTSTSDQWTVSSSTTDSQNFSAPIIAGQYGQLYRQAVRYRRTAYVLQYNMCGDATPIGEVSYDNWVFNYDIARGNACPPQTRLPKAKCFDCDAF